MAVIESQTVEQKNRIREVLDLAYSDERCPSSYALVWEGKVLDKNPTMKEYSFVMSILQLFSFGRPFYKEYVKPEALILCKQYPEFLEAIDAYNYKLEDIFSCYGLFAVNLSKVAILSGDVEKYLNPYDSYKSMPEFKKFFKLFNKQDYNKDNVYDFDWGYTNCLQVVNNWYDLFGDPIMALVNYKYALNVYTRNTSMKLKKRGREYSEVFNTWGERYCSMGLQERLKIIKESQFTMLTPIYP